MGGKCSSECALCMVMCLAFPIGFCLFCQSVGRKGDTIDSGDVSNEEPAKFSIEDLLKVYDDMTVLHNPPEMCDRLHGVYHGDTSACTVDLSNAESSGFLSLVDGIDTAQQLCTQVDGNFSNGNCTINAAHWGQATIDLKQAACGARGGQWFGSNCALPM